MASVCVPRTEFNPETIGIHLPLNEEENELASIVFAVTEEELSRSLEESGSGKSGFEREVSNSKFEASRENLHRIRKLFDEVNGAREQFVENFPHWQLLRRENIRQLDEIVAIIRADKKKCNIGKVVGGVAGLAGAAAVTGALMFTPAAPAVVLPAVAAYIPGAAYLSSVAAAAAPAAAAVSAYLPAAMAAYVPGAAAAAAAATLSPVAVGGGVVAGVGGAAVAGAAATEVYLLQKRMVEAKDVLMADQLGFMYVESWFKHTKELMDAVEAVVGFDAMQSWIEDLNTSLSWFKDFDEMGDQKYVLFKSVLRLCIRRMLPRMGSLVGFGIYFAPVVITMLFAVFWLNRKNRFVFRCVTKMREMTLGLRRFLDPLELQRLIAAVGVKGAAAAELVALAMSHRMALGAFAGVGFVFNIANLVLAGVDMQNGSGSRHADEVANVSAKLQEEYDVLEQVYRNLTNENAVSTR